MSWRAWGTSAQRIKFLKGVKRKPPEPIRKWKVHEGDTVEVLAGKDKGKQGTVAVVDKKKNKVIVQGLNTHAVYMRPNEEENYGGKMYSESPLHVSNVALIDPKDGKPCRVRYKFTGEGEKVRVSSRSGMILPKPYDPNKGKEMTILGYTIDTTIPDGPSDTPASDTAKVTYIPNLLSFEEEIAKLSEEKLRSTLPSDNIKLSSKSTSTS